jgi:hypothetical protein
MYTGAKIGSVMGLILFILFGLIPSLLYGGYMGLTMSTLLLGPIASAGWIAQFIVAGGMGLGCVATLSLFLVLSALLGAGIEKLLRLI